MDVHEGMTPDDLYDAANRCWESITATEIHHLVNNFSARVQACCALQGECLNGHRRVIRGFEQGAAFGETIAADEAESEAKVSAFIFGSKIFFDGWNIWPEEERMARSIAIVSLLPEKTRQKIGMTHGWHGIP
jgi:hypothetical protein